MFSSYNFRTKQEMKTTNRSQDQEPTLPIWFFVFIMATVVGLYFLANLSLNLLPEPVMITKEVNKIC